MKHYEYAISEGFGTLTSHSVCEGEPDPVKGDIVMKEITQAEYEAFGPNRVPQYERGSVSIIRSCEPIGCWTVSSHGLYC